ncbi:MAG: pilus assembly protein CpaD [Hyphomicrobiales bacterium]|nr:MAG: pilus assembly protein CpaD [Hyphomicrobiales bacterium]
MSIVKNRALNPRPLDGMTGADKSAKKTAGNAFKVSLLMAAMLVGGCSSYNKDHVTVGSVPSDYRTKHPIVVSDNEVYEDLALSANTRKLSLRDRNVVRDFAFRFKRSGARSVRIVIPIGSRNERAARRVQPQISAELRLAGIRQSQIATTGYQASAHGDAASVRLVYSAMTAAVASECGVWNDDLARSPENRNYHNFGCATQNNLASMIANPADLLGPRGESEIDATRRDKVISDWREDGTSKINLPGLDK